jgi:GH43 family beta-xylosidase
MKYECHITCKLRDARTATRIASERGWKTSQIARDPLLGDDTFFYLTCHSSDYDFLFQKMTKTVDALIGAKVSVVREKIEETIHDMLHSPR